MSDVSILESVKQRNEDFQRLKTTANFAPRQGLVTEWAEEAIKIIKFNS